MTDTCLLVSLLFQSLFSKQPQVTDGRHVCVSVAGKASAGGVLANGLIAITLGSIH